MNGLPSVLRELLDESFAFESMYDVPPRFFSALAPHRTLICEAGRIPYELHEAFPDLQNQSLVFIENATWYPVGGEKGLPPSLSAFPDSESWLRAMDDYQRKTPLSPATPVVGEPETFGQFGVMTQSVLGPATGEWILVVDDENDTFVAARSATDIPRLEAVFGNRREEALGVLCNWERIKGSKPSWLREWLPAILEHVLGPEETTELLAAEGRWLTEL